MDKVDQMKRWLKRNTTEALRKPQMANTAVLTIGGTPSTTAEDEICRRLMTGVIPQLAQVTQEVELIYNLYSGQSHEDEKKAKAQEKSLQPIEEIHKHLEQARDVTIGYLSKKGKKIDEATAGHSFIPGSENPVGGGYNRAMPVGDRLTLDPDPTSVNEDVYTQFKVIIAEIGNMNDDELESKLREQINEEDLATVVEILGPIAEVDDEPL